MNNDFVLCVTAGVLCLAQETESNQLPPPVPPHCHAHDLMGLHKILSWWVLLQLLITHLNLCFNNYHCDQVDTELSSVSSTLLCTSSCTPTTCCQPSALSGRNTSGGRSTSPQCKWWVIGVLVKIQGVALKYIVVKLTLKNVFCLLSSLTSGINFLSGPVLHGLPAQHAAAVLRLRIP